MKIQFQKMNYKKQLTNQKIIQKKLKKNIKEKEKF